MKESCKHIVSDLFSLVEGIMYGQTVANIAGTIEIRDSNNFGALIEFDPDKRASRWNIPFMKKREMLPTDSLTITISQLSMSDDHKVTIAEGYGSYLEHVKFDDQVYWKLGDPFSQWMIPSDEFFLESDSSNREDYKNILVQNYESAQIAKEEIEKTQRNDKKMRTR